MESKIGYSEKVRDFLRRGAGLLIGGELVPSLDGETFETLDPATGQTLARVPRAVQQDIDRAVRAARAALDGPWHRMAPSGRSRLLSRLADLIETNADEFAELESIDNGKPKAFAGMVDVPLAIDHFRYFAGWASKLEGESIPVADPDMLVYTRKEPVGVVAAIIPWNFPILMTAWKLAPALAAGCTIVLKPAEQTPLSALRLGELIVEAGFPAGVVNICTGFGIDAGQALVDHPGVDKIAFTGSREVGKEIAARAAATLKEISLELGGKSPNIVLDDADVAEAAAGAARAIFYETGQTCSAGSRLMVHRSLYADMIDAVVEQSRKLRPGRGLDPQTTLGPVVSQTQLDRIMQYLDVGRRESATVVSGGRRLGGDLAAGFYLEPTVLVDIPDSAVVCREEIFGPVLVIQPYDDLQDAIVRANATDYGLAAGVWTRDVKRAHQVARALTSGSVWINCYNAFDAAVPFGGVKQSGYGRDGGRASLEKFLRTKSIWSHLG